MQEKRQHKRFSATAFLNMPIHLAPISPYFGRRLDGRLIDLSAGGMAILIGEMIPQGTFFELRLTFPDKSHLDCHIQVRHVTPRNGEYLVGIEFVKIPSFMVEKIETMSNDYIDCENRIQKQSKDVCQADCAFFNMCTKQERSDPAFQIDQALNLAFNELDSTSIKASK